MIALLDHDDLNKSRRAVLIASIFLLLLSKVSFETATLSLGEISLSVKRLDILGAGFLVLLYLVYTFFWHCLGTLQSKIIELPAQYKAQLETLLKQIAAEGSASELAEGPRRRDYEAVRKSISKADEFGFQVEAEDRKFQRWKLYLFTVSPPLVVASAALALGDGFGAMFHFLFR